jgi:hypothetical protein
MEVSNIYIHQYLDKKEGVYKNVLDTKINRCGTTSTRIMDKKFS